MQSAKLVCVLLEITARAKCVQDRIFCQPIYLSLYLSVCLSAEELEEEFQAASVNMGVVGVTEASLESNYHLFSNFVLLGYYTFTWCVKVIIKMGIYT